MTKPLVVILMGSKADLEHCTNIDAFDFAMPVIKENGRPVMRAINPT